MRNKFLLYFIILLTSIIFQTACGNEELNKEAQVYEAVPPSLQEKKPDNSKKMIRLSDKQCSELRIRTEKVVDFKRSMTIVAPGFVFPAPENQSAVSAPVPGRVVIIYAHEGERVKKGQILFELESFEFGSMVADYLQARAEENYQSNRLERIKSLVEKKISSQSELERTEADFLRATAMAKAYYSKLMAVGVSPKDIKEWEELREIDPHLKIAAPITGIINIHNIDLGQSVTAYDNLLTIIEPSKVLVKGYVSPEDGNYLRSGDAVSISRKDLDDKIIKAKITSINPALEETNKSLVLNIIANTQNSWPRPGENVRLQIESSYEIQEFSVPFASIVYNDDKPVIYVKAGPNLFEQRVVDIDLINGDRAVLKKGVKLGEEIAISQLFSLKALVRFNEYAE